MLKKVIQIHQKSYRIDNANKYEQRNSVLANKCDPNTDQMFLKYNCKGF